MKEFKINSRYTWPDGQPKRCVLCECTSFKTTVMSEVGGTVCEYKVNCENCGDEVGYWCYGDWEHAYIIYKFTYVRLLKNFWKRLVYEVKTLFGIFRFRKDKKGIEASEEDWG